jgi:hypothetical protein
MPFCRMSFGESSMGNGRRVFHCRSYIMKSFQGPYLGHIWVSFMTQTGRGKAIITEVSGPPLLPDLGNKKSFSPHSLVRKGGIVPLERTEAYDNGFGLRPVKRCGEVPLVNR